jgi:hypothetical protein
MLDPRTPIDHQTEISNELNALQLLICAAAAAVVSYRIAVRAAVKLSLESDSTPDRET